jgi:ribosome-associated translation inhibitor RaiA
MQTFEFGFGFRNEASLPDRVEAELRAEAEGRLRALTDGHTDITGASVAVEELTRDTTPHLYEVRVVVYMRPQDVFAVEKQETAAGALKGALDAVERQVREHRAKLRETWKRS